MRAAADVSCMQLKHLIIIFTIVLDAKAETLACHPVFGLFVFLSEKDPVVLIAAWQGDINQVHLFSVWHFLFIYAFLMDRCGK